MFAGRDYVQGTNWTYVGNASFATREPDELPTNWLNTVWMSWTAPFSGRVDLYGIQPPAHDYAVYTGSTLTNLKLVPLANGGSRLRTMPIQEGVQYHFQFTGDSDDFSLALNQLYPFTHATNDNFSNAPSVQGENAYGDPKSFLDASMEPGEPLHLGSVPQKSLWYQWQAPRYGNLNLSLANNFLTNDVVLAVYQGASVDTLTLIGKGTNTLRLPVVAGDNYYVAAAVPDSIIGDIIPAFTLTQASSAEHPVPGNLLANPSFEPSWTNAQNWSTSGGLGGYFGSSGGADGSTWPVIPMQCVVFADGKASSSS